MTSERPAVEGRLLLPTPRGEVVSVPYWERDGIAFIDDDITLGPIEAARALAVHQEHKGSIDRDLFTFDWWNPLTFMWETSTIRLGEYYDGGVVTFSLHDGDFPSTAIEGSGGLLAIDTQHCLDNYTVPSGSYYESITSEDTGISDEEAQLQAMCDGLENIRQAMEHWTERVPSVTFETYDSSKHTYELVFRAKAPWYDPFQQTCMFEPLSNFIAMSECSNKGRVAHEIAHALGVPHEHQTSEAALLLDSSHGSTFSFDYTIYGFESTTPLDFGSVMMYDSYHDTDTWSDSPHSPVVVISGASDYTLRMVITNTVYEGSLYQSWISPACDRDSPEHWSPIPSVGNCHAPFDNETVEVYCGLSGVTLSDQPVVPVGSTPQPAVEVSFNDCYGSHAGDYDLTNPAHLAIVQDASNYTITRVGFDAGDPDHWRVLAGVPTLDPWEHSNEVTFGRQRAGLSPLDVSAYWDLYDQVLPDGEPAAYGEEFGAAITQGDFDWDGIIDLAVGVPEDKGHAGSVVIYKGIISSPMGETSLKKWALIKDVRPWSLASGDLDGDGFDELIVGSDTDYDEDGTGDGIGEVLVFMGDHAPHFDTPWRITPPLPAPDTGDTGTPAEEEDAISLSWWDIGDTPQLGYSLDVGDIDGDEVDDLVIGAPGANAKHGFHGVPGYFVSDYDGDGTVDVKQHTGAVLLLRGQVTSSGDEPLTASSLEVLDPYVWSMPGHRGGARFGHAIALGQMDTDGCLDLAVGAPFDYRVGTSGYWGVEMSLNTLPNEAYPTTSSVGQVYSFKGDPAVGSTSCVWPGSWNSAFDFPTVGSTNDQDSEFGYSLAAGPIVHSQTSEIDDLVVGAPAADTHETSGPNRFGAVYVFLADAEVFDATPSLADTPYHTYTIHDFPGAGIPLTCSAGTYDRFGHAVALGNASTAWRGLAGTSEPSRNEIAVGAPGRDANCSGDPPEEGEGAVYLFSGAPTHAALQELTAPTWAQNYGASYGVSLTYLPQGDYYTDTAHGTLTTDPGYEHGKTSIWIGAPGADNVEASGSGAVLSMDGEALYQGL